MKLTRSTLKLLVIKYLWLLILLPKMLQFAVYTVILFLLVLKRPIRPDKGVSFIVLGSIVQIIAILWQCIAKDPSLSRIAAGINTSIIWIISSAFYTLFLEEETLELYHKYFCRNLMIMFCVFLFSLVSRNSTFNILGHTLYLRRMDYLSSGTTSRFAGLTETVLGPSHFYAFTLPVILLGKDRDVRGLVLAVLGFICVFATHSRMGVVCCGGMLVLYIRQFLMNRFGASKVRLFDLFVILLAVVFVCFFWRKLLGLFVGFFNARGGSNEARFTIYRKSLKAFWNENPLFGCGIKNMIDMGNGYSFPYGSHSMYIGFLYKTGIVGTVCYFIGFLNIFARMSHSLKKNRNGTTILLMFACYFVMLIFADLDASDWVIVTMFSTWGILSNAPAVSSFKKEEVNYVW